MALYCQVVYALFTEALVIQIATSIRDPRAYLVDNAGWQGLKARLRVLRAFNVFECLNDNYPIDKQEWVTWNCAIKRARGNLVHFSELNFAFPPFR